MKRILAVGAALALCASPASAHGPGYGRGPGMMGGYGSGPGMMGGHGPGMMGGYGPGRNRGAQPERRAAGKGVRHPGRESPQELGHDGQDARGAIQAAPNVLRAGCRSNGRVRAAEKGGRSQAPDARCRGSRCASRSRPYSPRSNVSRWRQSGRGGPAKTTTNPDSIRTHRPAPPECFFGARCVGRGSVCPFVRSRLGRQPARLDKDVRIAADRCRLVRRAD